MSVSTEFEQSRLRWARELEANGMGPASGRLAVIIPAHNEEAVIAATLRSVVKSCRREDIFVFCDACSDRTVALARLYVPEANVFDHIENVGKSRGVEKVLQEIVFPRGYSFVAVIDADTTIEPQFFRETAKVLENLDVACVVGQVKSRWYPKNMISMYRTFVYAVWQGMFKRLQSMVNAMTIASGCSTVWRSDDLRQLEFDHRMSTEDFGLTMQAHRKHVGEIRYAPSAVVWTQDPFGLTSYEKQSYRWTRAWWEAVRKYRLGLKWINTREGQFAGLSALDMGVAFVLASMFSFLGLLVLIPLLIIYPVHLNLGLFELNSRADYAIWLIGQYGVIALTALVTGLLIRRPRLVLLTPIFLGLIYFDFYISMKALASTARSQYRRVNVAAKAAADATWVSPERRVIEEDEPIPGLTPLQVVRSTTGGAASPEMAGASRASGE